MTKERLSTTSYVLLGAVEFAQPVTPYDLKRVVAERVGNLYEIPHSQYYDETAKLAKAGLMEERREGEGRRRLSYTITEDGHRALLRWLRMPGFERPEVRDPGLLKLAFSGPLDADEIGSVAREQVDFLRFLLEESLSDLGREGCEASLGAQLSRVYLEAALGFWERLGSRMPERNAVA